MFSNFKISTNQCLTCNNEILKQLGTLQGVFKVEINRKDGTIIVSHTDEISRNNIKLKLEELELKEINANKIEQDEPSEWGCVL